MKEEEGTYDMSAVKSVRQASEGHTNYKWGVAFIVHSKYCIFVLIYTLILQIICTSIELSLHLYYTGYPENTQKYSSLSLMN